MLLSPPAGTTFQKAPLSSTRFSYQGSGTLRRSVSLLGQCCPRVSSPRAPRSSASCRKIASASFSRTWSTFHQSTFTARKYWSPSLGCRASHRLLRRPPGKVRTGGQEEERYEAVPYGFQRLGSALAPAIEGLLARAREWFTLDGPLFQFRGGRLVASVSSTRRRASGTLIGRAQCFDDSVGSCFCPFGSTTASPSCRTFAARLSRGSQRLMNFWAPSRSSCPVPVSSAEFGFVETYERKKQELEPWLGDSRSRVRAFAEHMLQTLIDRSPPNDAERRSGSELRKRDYEQ